MACDPTVLMADAAAYQGLSPLQRALIRLQLLCVVSENGGGGGGGSNLTGAVDPNGVVAGTLGQIYTQVTGGASTIWVNTDGGTTWN